MTQTAKRQLSVRLSVFFAAVCTVFLLIGGPAEAEGPPSPSIEYVVAAGDTLWTIAARHSEPSDDIRRVIADIRETSGMDNSSIYPGQVLRIPLG
jgi:nucleoid-associated protein YgaU